MKSTHLFSAIPIFPNTTYARIAKIQFQLVRIMLIDTANCLVVLFVFFLMLL